MYEMKTPIIDGGVKQKPNQGLAESDNLLMFCDKTSTPDMPFVWNLEKNGRALPEFPLEAGDR